MANKSAFYKGTRHKRRNYIFIPALILLGVLSVFVVSFFSMQKYAVITKDSVEVISPFAEKIVADDSDRIVEDVVFEEVEGKVIFDEPDYSSVEQTKIGKVGEMRAIFVPAENMTWEKLEEYAARLSSGNSLVLEMKPRSGQLMWYCNSPEAAMYGLSQTTDTTTYIQSYINTLKDRGIYLVAQISCCVDGRFSTYSTSVALRNSLGNNLINETGTWLDPYNQSVRNYTVDMVRELWEMGFDEVVLADVAHPVIPEDSSTVVVYSRTMSSKQTPITAVCGFAKQIAEELSEEKKGLLSIYVYSPTALYKADQANGQDAELFFKLYDRVYYITDKYAFQFNVTDVEGKVRTGKVEDRFVPVVYNYLPDNTSWVLIDYDEEK
ncbi:MAG: putative glycoside hydrolase [Oscillospiraceae bacterium]|nr:putative glycoside hydrolase [Oscillospiraceae bacterium]